MTPAYTQNQHYENLAFYYANAAILLKCVASVHVEAFDDAVFWEKTFTYFVPDKKLNFIWASNTPSGNETTGSAQCLKYKNYLSNRFYICIDSDYRYLLQVEGIDATNFIFQTYTYSIENHLCFTSKLNAIAKKCTGVEAVVFDFEAFLLTYSRAIYDTFIWHLHFLRNGDFETFSKEEFNRILSLNGMPGFSINNNGESIIYELSMRCNSKMAQLRITHPNVDLIPEKAHFTALGLNQDNVYLYIRGHNLFDLILKTGNEVNNRILKIEFNRLENNELAHTLYAKTTPFQRELERVIVFEGYPEIEKVGNDISSAKIMFEKSN
jgi:hypothetical protein